MISPPPASSWFPPDPANACVLSRRLIHRLADSLDELIEACRAAVPLDTAAITRQAEAIRDASTVPPSVWLCYASALEAVRHDDPEALAAALLELAAVDLTGSAPAVRNFRDATLPTAMWDRYQGALAMDAHASVSLHPAPEQEFASASAHLAVARAHLKAADPALADEISGLIHEVVFARGEVQPGMEFGGATSFFAWGVTFLNARRHGSAVAMAAGLVHEAAHALLFAHTLGKPIVLNDPGERYASPLRQDARGMDGIFHATFVSARMCYALDRLLESGVLDQDARAEAAGERDAAVLAFQRGLDVVSVHARPVPEGEAALRGAVAYMQGRSACSTC